MTGQNTETEPGTAPDVPGVVVGWRSWLVRDPERPRLRSPLQISTEWPERVPLSARCELRGHPAPDPDCTCGLYAARDPSGVGGVGFGRVTLLGCVALWGDVVEGERGWRAGLGLPLVLFCGPALGEPARTELAEAYGVPVHPLGSPVALAVRQPGIAAAAERVRAVASGAPPDARLLDEAARAFVDVAGAPVPELTDLTVRRDHTRRRRFTVGTAVLAAVAASVLLLPPADAAAPPRVAPAPWVGVSPR